MKIHPRHFLVGFAMLTAAVLALEMTPRMKAADEGPKISLEALIPTRFGEWKLEDANTPIIGGPEVEALLEKIYSQMLSRTYINGNGERILLSIAYGSDQGNSMQVHRPEMCYPAQGFQIRGMAKRSIDLSGHTLPVMQLVATRGPRIEPITYWVMMGDVAVRGNWEQHFARLKYGLTGKIPYGIVIRVSTISADDHSSYRIQGQFIKDLLGALPVQYRNLLAGPVT